MSAPNMTRETLQKLVRHASPDMAARYIKMGRQSNSAVATRQVPALLKVGAG